MAFRILFVGWLDVTKILQHTFLRPWLHPQFQVDEEDKSLCIFNVAVSNGPVKAKYRNREDQFKDALLRYSVRRIENALRTNGFLSNPSNRVEDISIQNDDLVLIEKLMEEKNCDYQIKEGRNLFCAAGSPEDYKSASSFQKRSPTSRAICFNCDLPDVDYLCSNLSHPAILVRNVMGAQVSRFAASALCNRGEPGAENAPSQCRPGGHQCWERILEPEIDAPEIPSSPLALHEAFGYLDTVWRLAFGRKHALLRLTTMSDIAQLSQPCKTRSDFESMMSALAAVLKAMDIPEDLFPGGVSNIQKDHTLERIKDCLKHKLGEDYDVSCDRAIEALQAVNAVRYSQQHANQRELSKAFSRLGIPYPISSWSEAWGSITSKAIEALGVIREKVRLLSLSSDVS